MIGNMTQVYSLRLCVDWSLFSIISLIDRFDATWSSIEKKERHSLKQLKSIATIKSVGASTRIEGSKMSDEEVDVLLKDLRIEKLEERDAQEVAGYFEVLELISESYKDIEISENSILDLHNRLLKYSVKDEWHRGKYKQLSNSVEATLTDGTKRIIFETTPPGFETDEAMRKLFDWYYEDTVTHSLVKCAIFTYEFLSIHPFQDGNGRLSRLISTLLLLKHNYTWIQYVSFEHEIENRKTEYYQKLRLCQSQRPHEDVTPWVYFYFDALIHIQQLLQEKLKTTGITATLSIKEKSILQLIKEYPGIQSGDIAVKLALANPTVKRILSEMIQKKLLEKQGIGRSTSYRTLD